MQNNPNQKQGRKLRKEKRMQIQGRVDVKALAMCAKYFNIRDINAQNRSDLLNMIALLAQHVIKNNYPSIKPVTTAHEAFKTLEHLGITWKSDRAKKRKRRMLEDEDAELEGWTPQSNAYEGNLEQQFKEAEQIAKQKVNQQTEEEYMNSDQEKPKARPGTRGEIAPSAPSNAPIKSEKELDKDEDKDEDD